MQHIRGPHAPSCTPHHIPTLTSCYGISWINTGQLLLLHSAMPPSWSRVCLTASQHDCAVCCLNVHPTKVPVHKFQSCFTNCAEETVEHSCHIWHESPAWSIDDNDGTSCSRNVHSFVTAVLFAIRASGTFAPICSTYIQCTSYEILTATAHKPHTLR